MNFPSSILEIGTQELNDVAAKAFYGAFPVTANVLKLISANDDPSYYEGRQPCIVAPVDPSLNEGQDRVRLYFKRYISPDETLEHPKLDFKEALLEQIKAQAIELGMLAFENVKHTADILGFRVSRGLNNNHALYYEGDAPTAHIERREGKINTFVYTSFAFAFFNTDKLAKDYPSVVAI